MLNFCFLTQDFFSDYSQCPHIPQKPNRPFAQVVLEMNGVVYCMPFRSNIPHEYAFWTDKENRCGIDYANTVVIRDRGRSIDQHTRVHIRQNEFDALRGKDFQVKQGLERYIRKYFKAKEHLEIPRNKTFVELSCLQYFEDLIEKEETENPAP